MKNRILWVIQVLLACLFLFAGGMKLFMPLDMIAQQTHLSVGFLRFVAVAEILGAFGLVLPWALKIQRSLTPLAAMCLVVIMIGAVTITIQTQDVAHAAFPFVTGILLLVVAFYRFADTAPDTFRVQRSQSIEAPPERIYPLIEDFHRWEAWSPFEKMDRQMKKNFSGSASGRGAVYSWVGNRRAGEGRMEILETAPASRVKIKLDFLKPFEGHNVAEFTLAPRDGRTEVTWAMYGPQPFLAKVMSAFFNMDRMIGKEFETGLSNMKTVAEQQA